MKIAVVGATGLVGTVMMKVLEERNFPVTEFYAVASARSKGQKVTFKDKVYTVMTAEDALGLRPDIALFSAGGDTSKEWAPRFAEQGTVVIDNSSAWRMEPDVPLVVPEVNGHVLTKEHKIIANPNCSTIQLVMVLEPLQRLYGIKRVIVSTYQSVTGTGKKAVDQLDGERRGEKVEQAYPYPIDLNAIPHCDIFLDNDYTKEEMKLMHESRKIMGLPELRLTATAVRLPVKGGHSEAVNVEFENPYDLSVIRKTLSETPGVVLQDQPEFNKYPMPRFAEGRDEVFVGRLRADTSCREALNLFVVSDNLRKGAATNAVQIAELLVG
ncbi:aspartate-semialdehyde dehydrogenase [Cryomorphaceae bacterium]|nr:aspartate-semialdehyde dehydrogenase [Cryomorphaceae bacterium]